MGWFTALSIWLRLGIIGLVVAAIFGGGMWFEAQIKNVTIANQKADALEKAAGDATTALNQFQTDVGTIHKAASDYQDQKKGYENQFAALSKEFNDAIKKKPLPPDCRPDAERLRALNAAVQAANSTTNSTARPFTGAAVP